ncbi:hypothetical protein PBI_LUCKY2013_231 [Mycobacterium phage Lucky2013]|nr:hypothetical protein PORCELAIN_235 [Mycobacterium phage Porcelain]ASD53622.1 hypothetical protein PBI_LUCKY2013_231 [Mycobacterium phage Lucky2013]ATN89947.1 hypothetical protein SEA_KLEIN_241 [Mycobacterium phage Klein]
MTVFDANHNEYRIGDKVGSPVSIDRGMVDLYTVTEILEADSYGNEYVRVEFIGDEGSRETELWAAEDLAIYVGADGYSIELNVNEAGYAGLTIASSDRILFEMNDCFASEAAEFVTFYLETIES